MDGYLTTEEIAQKLGVKVETVRRWIHHGKLSGLSLGRAGYRIRQEDFDHFVRGQYQQQSEPLAHALPTSSVSSSSANNAGSGHMEATATLILERMTDGALLFDFNGRCLYANEAVGRLLGSTPSELLGKTRAQLLPWDNFDAEEHTVQNTNDYFSSATQRWYQIRTFATPQGRCVSFLDVTERIQSEQALRESRADIERQQRFFDTVLNSLAGYVFAWNRQHQFVYANRAAEKVWGLEPGGAVGKTLVDLAYPLELREFLTSQVKHIFETGEVATGAVPYISPIGISGYFDYVYSPVLADDGTVELVVGMAHDTSERRRMEQALRESEEKYRTLFESIDEAFFIADVLFDKENSPIDIFYVEANPAMAAITGQELNGKHLTEIDRNHESDWYEVLGHVALTGQSVREEQYAGPLQKWVDFYAFKPGNASSRRVAVLVRDITARKRMEESLRASEKQVLAERQRLYDLFMQAPAAITVMRGPEHVFELLNPLASQLVGLHRSIIDKSVREAFSEVEGQVFFDLLDTVYQTGKPFIGNETPIQLDRKGDGTLEQMYFNFVYQPSYNPFGEIDGVLSFTYDVTDVVLARKRVEESEERLRAMANSMPQLVWSGRADGAIDFFNERMNEYAEIPRNEEGIYEWQAIVHPDDRAVVMYDWRQATSRGSAFEHEQRMCMKDGTYRWHLSRGLPTHDTNGKIIRWYGTKTDIEHLKQLEQQQLDFLGVVSHELRTPVTSAKAFTEVLESRFSKAGDKRSASLLAKMNAQMEKLTLLINDLLDVTRMEAGKLQFHEDFFPFDDLVRDIIEEVQRTTTTHSIQREGTTNTIVYGDRERIGQVITNLLTNAIKYSPNATTVIISASHTQQEVTLCVQDFGIGIASDKLPHVFERFFRESGTHEETFPGLGLGLYVAAEIIQRQGGRIWAESEKGRGSKFCFSLPLQENKDTRLHNDLFVEGKGTYE